MACSQSRWGLHPTLLGKLCMASVRQIRDLDRGSSKAKREGAYIGYVTERYDEAGAARYERDK